jgi:hypothetical protein
VLSNNLKPVSQGIAETKTMSKRYSIFSTKEDYEKAYSTLQELEKALDLKLDWVKLKKQGLDQLSTLIGILNRKKSNLQNSK